MKKLIALLLSAFSLTVVAQTSPMYLNALAVNGINMRSQASVNSRVLTKIPFGKKVEVLEGTGIELQLGWVSSSWLKVRFRGREGYVFGGYLTELPIPRQIAETEVPSELIPLYCNGSLKQIDKPIVNTELDFEGDTLYHTFQKFENGFEMELEQKKYEESSMLVIPYSIQETYILLEALLKLSGNKTVLSELRFIKGNDGVLIRINSVDGTIKVSSRSQNLTELRLLSSTSVTGQVQR